MADKAIFPLDRSKGLLRGVVATGMAFLTLVMGAATLYLLLSCFLPFLFEDLWMAVLMLLPMAAGAFWFTGTFFLTLVRMYTRAAVGKEGVTLMLPLRREKRYAWSDFQQVCICYSSAVPGKNDGVSVLCFIRHGEKRNLYDRWKADNAWHYRRLIVADHTAEIEAAVRAVCPTEVADLRGSIAYPDPRK